MVLAFSRVCLGQDIHFSQFNGSLLNLSPAFTGFFNGDLRIGAIYRSQWQAVPVPYSTISMAGEARFRPKGLTKDMVGVGATFNNDVAGDARYGTTQFLISGSYIHSATQDSSFLISFGLNMGICQVGFDYNKMTFDNQFDGIGGLNAGIATGEKFDWTKYNYVDFTGGTAIQYRLNKKHLFVLGTGLHHITTPVITYQGNNISKLDFKFVNYLAYSTPIGANLDIIADAIINTQGKYYEIIPHGSLKYYFSRDNNKAVLAGVSLRARDAFIIRLGYHEKTLQSGIAYDINVSKFTAATNRRGAFEIYVNYVFKRQKTYTVKKRVCPVFM